MSKNYEVVAVKAYPPLQNTWDTVPDKTQPLQVIGYKIVRDGNDVFPFIFQSFQIAEDMVKMFNRS